jgi:cysteinyl-tRNA synthetase
MFRDAGYKTTHVINITDVGHLTSDSDVGEDKLEKGARREGKSVWDIATMYTEAFMNDIKALGIDENNFIFPKATETIQEQIDLISTLEKKGYTYTTSDGVYFDTSKFAHYGDLAKLDIEGLQSGARVEENKEKRTITDFALWKFSPKEEKRQMEWDSPWGVGFPGWHIECSAMSKKILGEHFDIHTGGVDHIPVHHTNEIAQSVCANESPFVNYWMHVNFLNDTTGKMSKSNDDFLTLSSLIKEGYDPFAYRYFLLTTHYRKEVTFSYEALTSAHIAYKKLVQFSKENSTENKKTVSEKYIQEVREALYDDINTPSAIGVLWIMMKDDTLSNEEKYATLLEIDTLLGLNLHSVKKEISEIPPHVQTILDKRTQARLDKDFALSDTLRDDIAKLGYIVKDTKDGQEVTPISE